MFKKAYEKILPESIDFRFILESQINWGNIW